MSQIQKSSIKFLKDLSKNNNRDWFNENRDRYEAMYLNMQDFVEAVTKEMMKYDNIIEKSPKKSLYRIYRDVRFSKDKSPYKSHMAGGMTRDTEWLRGGYYFGIEPGGRSMMGTGFWNPNKEDLKLIRDQISADPKPLRKILKSKKFKDTFGELEGEKLKTCPKGFDKEDPAVDLLRHKQFLTYVKYKDSQVTEKGFYKQLVKDYRAARPFLDYMSEILTHDLNGVPLVK